MSQLTGLISAYLFENNVNDSFGSHNGTNPPPAGYGAGKIGRAAYFDETGQINVSPPIDHLEFSIVAWINVNTSIGSGYRAILTDNGNFGFYYFNGKLLFYPGDYMSTSTLASNTWYFVCVTYNGSDLNFYVNGTLEATYLSASIGFNSFDRIGSEGGSGAAFYGAIDELYVYNRAVTNTELVAWYNGGIGLPFPGKVKTGFFNFF